MGKHSKPSEQIIVEVSSWPGVKAGPGDRGGLAFRVGKREIGHLHGDYTAHFHFPERVWAGLREQGRITAHPFFPLSQGLAARDIENEDDVRDVIALMRLNYERIIGLTTLYVGHEGNAARVA